MEKRWQVRPKVSDDIIKHLLHNRGLTDKKSIEEFFNPQIQLSALSSQLSDLGKAVRRIKKAIADGETIIIHGDYDVDGICGTAILWETIYLTLGYKNLLPFIPSRFEHGYGLSRESIDEILKQTAKLPNCPTVLLITIDCGITATDEVNYAKSEGFDVIVTDHHVKGGELPDAQAILWTDKVCGATIAWLLAYGLAELRIKNLELRNLDLVALATIADLQPLLGPNRALVTHGLEELNRTPRTGLQALIKASGLQGRKIGPYEVGWMLAPRLNAAGRLENALDSLRLLCTQDPVYAENLAEKLSQINTERQKLTNGAFEHAKKSLSFDLYNLPPLLILDHESYHEGIIGLVASKLVETFYRPAIAIARTGKISKGSARSVPGFNIVEAIRSCQELLIDAGGHPMAAGFTIETEKIEKFSQQLAARSRELLDGKDLRPVLKIDCEVDLSNLTWDLWEKLDQFEPFGLGNPRPTFLTKNVQVSDARAVGSEGKHLKLQISHFSCIGFGLGEWALKLLPGDKVNLVYNLDVDDWNNQRRLQLKIKDIKLVG